MSNPKLPTKDRQEKDRTPHKHPEIPNKSDIRITKSEMENRTLMNETDSKNDRKKLKEREKDTLSEHTSKGSKNSSNTHIVSFQSNAEPNTFIERFLIFLSYMLVVICFPVSLFCIFVSVRQFERAVILRNGKVHKNHEFGPGLIHYLPCVDVVKFTDLRIICYLVPPQEALTKDSLTISVDAAIYYKICEPVRAVVNVADYKSSTQFLAATTLRNALGTRNMSELLIDRPAVGFQIYESMKSFAREWGIEIVRVAIKDIYLPLQLQKTMAAEAESSRLANAKIIVAQAEIETTKSLQQATVMLMDNPLCMQLRYLQSLHMIASEKTHTIVFPFSVETFKKIFK